MNDIPDLGSLHSILLTVLGAFTANQDELNKAQAALSKLQSEKRELKKETAKLRLREPEEHSLLLQVAGQLAVRSVDEIPRVIATMQTVCRPCPTLKSSFKKFAG